MTTPSPFDHRPDEEIGSALRELLSAGSDAVLAARITAAAASVYGRGGVLWSEVLGGWARPGVAAAAVLALAATLWTATASSQPEPEVTLEDALRPVAESVAPPVLVAATTEPELERLMWEIPDPDR
jgi:hypothetical protein